MKKIIAIILCLALICTVFCGCSSGKRTYRTYVEPNDRTGSDASASSNVSTGGVAALVGNWYAQSEQDIEGKRANRYIPKELELNSDGSGDTDFFDINYPSETIVWTASNGKLTITSDSFDYTYDYTIEGNRLILLFGDSCEGVLYRN